MNRLFGWLKPWIVPAILVALAVAATVPWTWAVVRAAHDRDVLENALMLAKRVAWQVWLSRSPDLTQPINVQQVRDALEAELFGDDSVYLVIYYERPARPPSRTLAMPRPLGPGKSMPLPKWTDAELLQRTTGGLRREEDPDSFNITVPWRRGPEVVGFTYVELNRQALRQGFWKKEGPLLKRVLLWTGAGVSILSAVGIFAWRVWRGASRAARKAELAQQGLLAERGLTAAVMAHEIRNPLGALRFQIHSLRRNGDDPQRVASACDTIDAELSRIQQLVQDYLAHERAQTLRVGRVDLAEAVRALQTLMEALLQQSSTTLVVEEPGKPVAVRCDPHALRQILMNLVLNAQQAMGRGGRITVRVGREDGFGTIDVADTGPGIPPEMRDRLFKPFQTSKKEGSGIGLALVRRFVDNFSGTVSVDSEPGAGATFHLRLPLDSSDGPGVDPRSVAGEQAGAQGNEPQMHAGERG